ncbi:hypothetical protein LTR56_018644 [Elasticomyces elasticus]|nr:hypothetical protein LTR56_018644 [Elasticomyces elasticus]KAK3635655.1 hypothetical protein LTR22_019082 [Elasticomyces elasticus]KAK4933099.1 hypothetical protein LTR49_000583 [Elasticomyces elasticus]KAK5763998.1 hypothetical protein LTS12_005908 [Elasticomyces elasticus]
MPDDTTEILAQIKSVLATACDGKGAIHDGEKSDAQAAAAELAAKRLEPDLPTIISILTTCRTLREVQDLLNEQRHVVEQSRPGGSSHRKQPALAKTHKHNLQRLADLLGATVCCRSVSVRDGKLVNTSEEPNVIGRSKESLLNVTFKDWFDDPNSTPRMPVWQPEPHQYLASTGEEIRAVQYSRRGVEGFETMSKVGRARVKGGRSAGSADDDVVASSPDIATPQDAKSQSSDVDSPALPDAAVRRRVHLIELQAAMDVEAEEYKEEVAARLRSQNQMQAQALPKKNRKETTETTNDTPRSTRSRAAKKQTSTSTPAKKLETFKVMSSRQLLEDELKQDSSALSAAKSGTDEDQTDIPAQPCGSAQPSFKDGAKKSLLVTLHISPIKLAGLEASLLAKREKTSSGKRISSTTLEHEQAPSTATVAPETSHDTTNTRADGRKKIILKLGHKRNSRVQEMQKRWDRVPEVWPESAIRTHADREDGDAASEKRARSLMDDDVGSEAATATKKARLE